MLALDCPGDGGGSPWRGAVEGRLVGVSQLPSMKKYFLKMQQYVILWGNH